MEVCFGLLGGAPEERALHSRFSLQRIREDASMLIRFLDMTRSVIQDAQLCHLNPSDRSPGRGARSLRPAPAGFSKHLSSGAV
jgi:hypothetical protein